VTIPCGGKHIVCFPCFIQTQNGKCPMCRYDYVEGVRRDDEEQEEAQRRQLEEEAQLRREEEAQRRREEYEEQWFRDEHDYTFYQDLNLEFNGNYQQAVDEAGRIWKDFARLDQAAQDSIYEKLEQAMRNTFYIYNQLRNEIYNNEDDIIGRFISSFDVCRVVYLSKIIIQPDNEEAYQRLKEYEECVYEELENGL